MDSATATTTTTGFSEPAEGAEPTRPTTVLPVSAGSATAETSTETASRATSEPTATITKGTMMDSKPASASRVPSTSEEDARKSLSAPTMPTTTPSAASVTLATSSTLTTHDAWPSPFPFLTAPATPSSTESAAPATSVSSSNLSTPALPAPQEPPGTVRFALPPPAPSPNALLATSTTPTFVSASLQLLHAVTMPSSTEPLAFVLTVTTGSTEFARNVLKELFLMVLSVPPFLFLPLLLAVLIRFLLTESACATVDFISSTTSVWLALPTRLGTASTASADATCSLGAWASPSALGTAAATYASVKADTQESTASAPRLDFMMDNLFPYFPLLYINNYRLKLVYWSEMTWFSLLLYLFYNCWSYYIL